jgi:hypothetical protein
MNAMKVICESGRVEGFCAAPQAHMRSDRPRELEAQITQSWVVFGSAPERPVVFAV